MKRTLFIVIGLLLSVALSAQQFEPMEYDGLPYQQLSSNIDGAEKPTLVLFLHGGHARGEDNQKQIQLQAVKDIKNYILKNNIPAYFLVPQCPGDMEWIPNRGATGCKDKLLGLIREYADEKGINPSRIYLCSVSMGSWASWVLVKENPDLFAAAFIASGNHKGVSPEQLTGTPLYITVGSRERSLDAIKWMAGEILKAGGTAKFDTLTGCDHPKACDKAFTDKRLEWLFEQKKTANHRRSHLVVHLPAGDVHPVQRHQS
jgi:pimeloyl-ACP methyl ester carboxylesterase